MKLKLKKRMKVMKKALHMELREHKSSFIVYVVLISKMQDIRRVFQYHGAEHQTIHCYENGLELTPENCARFETLHPRCGTSFIMFVFLISLLLFSFLLT